MAVQQRKKGTLTKAEIIAAAFAIVDESGADACSMRTLGARVGVTAMALYGYVPSREALLNEVAASFLESVDVSQRPGELWEETLMRTSHSLRRACQRHPHLANLLNHPAVGEGLEAYMMRLRSVYLAQGMPEDIAIQLVAMADALLAGYVLRSRQRLEDKRGEAKKPTRKLVASVSEEGQGANQGAGVGASSHVASGSAVVPAAAQSEAPSGSGNPYAGRYATHTTAAPAPSREDAVSFAATSRVPGMLTGRAPARPTLNDRWRKSVVAGYSDQSFDNALFVIIAGIHAGAAPDPCAWRTPAPRV